MPDLKDGESVEVQGSARLPYLLRNVCGVYSCSCPAWRNQSLPIDLRSCKHLRSLRGEAAERARVGDLPARKTAPRDTTAPKAPALLLAQSYDPNLDPTDWLMSEKLDGVRAWWDGKRFLSRLGNVYHAPAWFTANLPATPLDGELWLGRRAFQRTISIVRRHDQNEHWREVRYVLFDAPAANGPFEERLAYLEAMLREHQPPFASLLPQVRCTGSANLQAELARITALGGEGLMLREPGSAYAAGRSATLLKVKPFHDAEARVIGHLPGRGRHLGRLGALEVILPNGLTFAVGSGLTDAQRREPPPVGSVITYRYQELTDRGIPRFPTFVRVRRDG